jgi:uncharacterized protein YbbC (DUF1343 family)
MPTSFLLFLFIISIVLAVKPGIDNDISILFGKRVGLITNPSGVNYELESTIDILFNHRNVKLVALFAPEHGLRGDRAPGEWFPDYVDPVTNLTVYSLYNEQRIYAPTQEQIKKSGIEMFVLDLQDVGSRCYTFTATMYYCLKAAKDFNLPIVILDRVNPIGARDTDVQGPILHLKYQTFIGIWTLPMTHAMTFGELAHLFNAEMNISHTQLHVIKLVVNKAEDPRQPRTYQNARWLLPSPNLPTLLSSLFYPGMVIFEALANVSLGRGTTIPFHLLGAPYFDNRKLVTNINMRIANDTRVASYFNGVKIIPTYFIPHTSIHVGKQCAGIQLVATSPESFEAKQSVPIAITLLSALLDLYDPSTLGVSVAGFNIRFGTDKTYQDILSKKSVPDIIQGWEADLNTFQARRHKYLLY